MTDSRKTRRKAMRAYGEYVDCAAWLAEIKSGHDTESDLADVPRMNKHFQERADAALSEHIDYVSENGQ